MYYPKTRKFCSEFLPHGSYQGTGFSRVVWVLISRASALENACLFVAPLRYDLAGAKEGNPVFA
jgi:hypothetical protein